MVAAVLREQSKSAELPTNFVRTRHLFPNGDQQPGKFDLAYGFRVRRTSVLRRKSQRQRHALTQRTHERLQLLELIRYGRRSFVERDAGCALLLAHRRGLLRQSKLFRLQPEARFRQLMRRVEVKQAPLLLDTL